MVFISQEMIQIIHKEIGQDMSSINDASLMVMNFMGDSSWDKEEAFWS